MKRTFLFLRRNLFFIGDRKMQSDLEGYVSFLSVAAAVNSEELTEVVFGDLQSNHPNP